MQSPRYYASMLAMTGRIDRFMYQTSGKVIKTFFSENYSATTKKKIQNSRPKTGLYNMLLFFKKYLLLIVLYCSTIW